MKKVLLSIMIIFMFTNPPKVKAFDIGGFDTSMLSDFNINDLLGDFNINDLLSGNSFGDLLGEIVGFDLSKALGLQGILGNSLQCKLNIQSIAGTLNIGGKLGCEKAGFGLNDLGLDGFDKIGGDFFSCKVSSASVALAENVGKFMGSLCNDFETSANAAITNLFIKAFSSNNKTKNDEIKNLNDIFAIKYKSHKRISLLNTMNARVHDDKTQGSYASKAVYLISTCFGEAKKTGDPKKIEICNDPTNYYPKTYNEYADKVLAYAEFMTLPNASSSIASNKNSDDIPTMLFNKDLQKSHLDIIEKTEPSREIEALEITFNRILFLHKYKSIHTIFKSKEEALAWNVSDYDKMIYAARLFHQMMDDAETILKLNAHKKQLINSMMAKRDKQGRIQNIGESLKKYYDKLDSESTYHGNGVNTTGVDTILESLF